MKRNIKFYSLDKDNIVFLENFELDLKRNGEIRNLDRINFPISLSKIFGTTNTDSIQEASLNALKSFTPYLLEADLYVFRNTETNKYPEEYENGKFNVLASISASDKFNDIFQQMWVKIEDCFNDMDKYNASYITSQIDFTIFIYEMFVLPKQPEEIKENYPKYFYKNEELYNYVLEDLKSTKDIVIEDYHVRLVLKRLFILHFVFIDKFPQEATNLTDMKALYNELKYFLDLILPF